MYQLAWIFILGVVVPVSSPVSQQNNEYKYLVKGRVVDERGRPVHNATVVLEPPDESETWESIVNYHQTNSKGKFRIEEESTLPTLERVLYVITGVPGLAYAPIRPPFSRSTRSDARLTGRRILVERERETDLGDIAIQVRYGLVLVHLQDSQGVRLFKAAREEGALPNIRLAIRSRQGDMVDRGMVSPEAFHRSESTIAVALPEGDWQLEVACESGGLALNGVSIPLTVRASGRPLTTSLRLRSADLLPEASDAIQVSDEGGARKALEHSGFAFTHDAFVERARWGNIRAVLLFLEAGMSPNVRAENSETALTAAIREDHGDMVRILLSRGADVNAREEDGAAALIIAAGGNDAGIVQLLLRSSADVNAKAKNGTTALMMATGNSQIDTVRLLLSAGADVNAKNKDGKTALMIATEVGRTELIKLLEQYASER